VTANTVAHSQLIALLNGNSTLVQPVGGQVVLNLAPLPKIPFLPVSVLAARDRCTASSPPPLASC
jgi:hypothetical protein